jgi:thiol-disulfide isomerase/thioredoxin
VLHSKGCYSSSVRAGLASSEGVSSDIAQPVVLSSIVLLAIFYAFTLSLLVCRAEAEPLAAVSPIVPVLNHALSQTAVEEPVPVEESEPTIDLSFSSLSLTNLSGAAVDSDELENKKVVIYFWSIYCRGCVGAFEELETLRSDLAKENAELLTVHLFEPNTEKLISAVRRIGISLPILLAPKKIRELFAIRLLPTSLVFDRKHQLVARFEGKYNDSDVRLSILNKVSTPIEESKDQAAAPVAIDSHQHAEAAAASALASN